jgi:hypothetical protein
VPVVVVGQQFHTADAVCPAVDGKQLSELGQRTTLLAAIKAGTSSCAACMK